MGKITEITEAAAASEPSGENEQEHVLRLSKIYTFEGREHTHVDLSRLEELTTIDLTKAEKLFTTKGGTAIMPEMNILYCSIIAASASGLPIEFFEGLPARDMIKIKNHLVASFFADGE